MRRSAPAADVAACAPGVVERATVSPAREKCRPRPPHGSAPRLVREETWVAQIFWTETLVNLLLKFDGDSEHIAMCAIAHISAGVDCLLESERRCRAAIARGGGDPVRISRSSPRKVPLRKTRMVQSISN